jgi:hypothetical protein
VRGLIRVLAASTSGESAAEIARLRMLPEISRWHTDLDAAAHDQRRLQRMTFYRHADPKSAAQMFANAAPANPKDLTALIIDELVLLERDIRGDETNKLRLFWRDAEPKVENDCRDVLMTLLRDRLFAKHVQVEKEGSAADDNRCDIRAVASANKSRVTVPIEIKRDSHANVWTAWKSQLQDLYSIDPSSGGFGIYLVLWFGRPKTPPTGQSPASASEMSVALRQSIPDKDRQVLEILVCDLSLPPRASSGPSPRAKRTKQKPK